MRSSYDPSRTRSGRRPWRTALALGCLLAASSALRAETAESETAAAPSASDAVLASLQSRYEHIDDLRAEFVQEAYVASLGKRDVSRGRVVMQRPGRMRWEYVDPEERVIVLDAGTLRVYTPSEAQLQIAAATSGAFSPTALGFLLGEGDLRTDFTSETLDGEGRDEIGVLLRPRGDAAFERLEMWLAPASHQLRESVVVDVFGNRTSVRFAEISENAGVDAGAFDLQVPDGTDVIDLR